MTNDKTIKNTEKALTIVGIGSSAGGLEAIRELVATLPTDIPASYVVVQHMSPHHKSLMTELVVRHTELLVEDVTDGIIPQANVIYITPPKTDIIFEDGRLRLVEISLSPTSPRPSVDRFLLSLADSHGADTMAVILSGTGSDGAYGVQAIREAGGITIAQDSESAKYDGMPWAAIQTGCVDLILSPQDIGTHLQKILNSQHDFTEFRKGTQDETPYSDLLHIILARTRVDFREYKQTTIGRRIERRMVALGIDNQDEYTQFCRNNPHAVDALFKDLLISVTRFFRDKDEFKQLKAILPQLIQDRGDAPLRVWIAGCATGEEAYSIAMLLSEAFGGPEAELKTKLQIFATDIDKAALQVARRGVYGLAALNDVPPELSKKYLIHHKDGVRVIDSLRQAILFSDHNVCQDPPFQKLDLVCCRNLLIYFGNSLQRRVLARFHFVMNPHGLMFLGTAENISGSDQLFVPHRESQHMFRKRVLRTSKQHGYSMPNLQLVRQPVVKREPKKSEASQDRALFEALVGALGENSMLVTEDYLIASVYGDVSTYIEIKNTSTLKMHIDLLRSPLREEARTLITLALKNGTHHSGVRHLLRDSKDDDGVRLDVYPILAKDPNERAALVVFTQVAVETLYVAEDALPDTMEEATVLRIRTLENELATSRDALQQTIEELETSNEELQSLNEELQSTNEELQATNEELETSNEELQSTNEELITVNEELQVTASELSGRTGELTSVLQSTPLAILVTDSALQITQATQAASTLFGLQTPIASPHISQCKLPDGYPLLAPFCNEALKLGQSISMEFDARDARVKLSCTPYFNAHGAIMGVTMVATEFPGVSREVQILMESSHLHIMNRTRDGKILRISETSANILGLSRDEAIGLDIHDLVDPKTSEILRKRDLDVLDGDGHHSYHEAEIYIDKQGQTHWQNNDRFQFLHAESEEPTIYSIAADITSTIQSRDRAQDLNAQITLLQDFAHVGYWTLNLKTQEVYWSKEVYRIHREDPKTFTPVFETAISFYHPEDIDDVQHAVQTVAQDGGEFVFNKRLLCKDDEIVHITIHGKAVTDHLGQVIKIVGIFTETDGPAAGI